MNNKTIKELIELCKERKIKGYSGKKKEQLISLLTTPIVKEDSSTLEGSLVGVMTYVDLFSGIGGFRYGIEMFSKNYPSYKFKCIKTADIKKDAIST